MPSNSSCRIKPPHKGLYCYTQLNFGTNSASEIFQHTISEQLHDMVVYGKTEADHDSALKKVFQKFSDVNLTLNKSKCEFNKSSISFFELVDPERVKAIRNMSPPKSALEVRSFLGMSTYCSKFIPSFSDISYPLCNLTNNNAKFHSSQEHQRSFNKIKDMLTSETMMAYFNPAKEPC